MADNRLLQPFLMGASSGVFAVLDGAQFADLPSALFDGDFVHKPLYLDRGNGSIDQVRTGPQLIWLDRDRRTLNRDAADDSGPPDSGILSRLLDLVGDQPAAVFWTCSGNGDALYKHLRTINKIQLSTSVAMERGPTYAVDPLSEDGSDADREEYEWVIFRHADGNVMAQVMPALSLASRSRMLGPAEQILFSADSDWSEKPMRLARLATMPPATSGPLRLSVAEVGAIENTRSAAARRRRILYLRETCPTETKGMSTESLQEYLRASERSGSKLGLVSEGAHCRWAYLMVATRGQIAQAPEVATYIKTGGSQPDEQVRLVMRSTIEALKKQRVQLEAPHAF